MNRLIIDTATKVLYLGITSNDTLIHEIRLEGQNDHSKTIMVQIDKLFSIANMTLDSIDEIIVGHGPGSYTGLRIGITIAKVFAYTRNIPLRSVSSLFLMASGYSDAYVAPMIDARRSGAFCAVYHYDMCLLPEQIRLRSVFDEQTQAIENLKFVFEDDYKVDVKRVIKNASEPVKNVHAFVPNYLRETEAERNLGAVK